jgi:glycerol-3-phosphate acyltransferase PlsY
MKKPFRFFIFIPTIFMFFFSPVGVCHSQANTDTVLIHAVSLYNHIYFLLFTLGVSYLLGSIPFGLLVTRLAGHGDIRKIGSGNIGATNVLRTGSKKLAALTLLLDGAKGAAAVLITQLIIPELAPIAGFAALLGHLFPVWLHFKGGKGVATAIGVITALAWPVGLAIIWAWLVVAKFSRYSSLAALVSLGLAPALAILWNYIDYLWVMVAILLLVIWKHETNIKRLINGTEPIIGDHLDATPPSQ